MTQPRLARFEFAALPAPLKCVKALALLRLMAALLLLAVVAWTDFFTLPVQCADSATAYCDFWRGFMKAIAGSHAADAQNAPGYVTGLLAPTILFLVLMMGLVLRGIDRRSKPCLWIGFAGGVVLAIAAKAVPWFEPVLLIIYLASSSTRRYFNAHRIAA